MFTGWCREQSRTGFPASAATVAAFVDEMGRIKTPATVRRYVSSIATVHKALGETNPLDSTTVRFALQRMHRRRGRRQAQVQGLTWPLRNRLIEATGNRLIDARDRALLAVGYDTLLRRAELVAVRVPDLLEEIDGTATLLVRTGKTDAEGRGATLYLARDTMQLVKRWVKVSDIDGGRLFRSVRNDGTVGEKLDPSQVPRIYKRMARQAGMPADVVDTLAGHSTRVGGGAGHDRVRNRAARDPAVRTLEDDPDGPPLRGAAARATQRRRPAGRAAEPVRQAETPMRQGRRSRHREGPQASGFSPRRRRGSRRVAVMLSRAKPEGFRPEGAGRAQAAEARSAARDRSVRTEMAVFSRIRTGEGTRGPGRRDPELGCDQEGRALFARDKASYREQPTCRNPPEYRSSTPPFIGLGLLALASLLSMF